MNDSEEHVTIGKYGPRIIPKPTWIPTGDEHTQASAVLQKIKDSVEYPPLFDKKSWTQGILKKDTQMFLTPSETIGL